MKNEGQWVKDIRCPNRDTCTVRGSLCCHWNIVGPFRNSKGAYRSVGGLCFWPILSSSKNKKYLYWFLLTFPKSGKCLTNNLTDPAVLHNQQNSLSELLEIWLKSCNCGLLWGHTANIVQGIHKHISTLSIHYQCLQRNPDGYKPFLQIFRSLSFWFRFNLFLYESIGWEIRAYQSVKDSVRDMIGFRRLDAVFLGMWSNLIFHLCFSLV